MEELQSVGCPYKEYVVEHQLNSGCLLSYFDWGYLHVAKQFEPTKAPYLDIF